MVPGLLGSPASVSDILHIGVNRRHTLTTSHFLCTDDFLGFVIIVVVVFVLIRLVGWCDGFLLMVFPVIVNVFIKINKLG